MVAKPERYQWSSYQSYIGQCTTPGWPKTDFIPGDFGGKASDANNSYGDLWKTCSTVNTKVHCLQR
jgi:putative transposase